MKVLHMFNSDNNGYDNALIQRELGIDAHLLTDETAYDPLSTPNWQENQKWNPPNWIHYVNKGARRVNRTIEYYRAIRGYDLIQGYPDATTYLQFQNTPYVMYEAGWMRLFPFGDGYQDKLARRGYKNAKAVIMTNPHLYQQASHMPYLPKLVFVPFTIDPQKYVYEPIKEDNDELTYLYCARIIWKDKGTDRFILAFADYLRMTKLRPRPKLKLIRRGTDLEKTDKLIAGLPKYIRDRIEYVPIMTKPVLIDAYHKVDIIAEQFVLGSYGAVGPAAMSCGRPLIMYINQKYNVQCYREMPPVANAQTREQITEQMMQLEDVDYRRELSKKGRVWVVKHHDPLKTGMAQKKLYEEILS